MEKFFSDTIRRYYELELPGGAGQPKRKHWPLLVALHGYQGNKDSMMAVARRIANGKMVVISLQGQNQFFIPAASNHARARSVGFGWGTGYKMDESVGLHHSAVRALIGLATRQYQADRSRVFLLGFSQACAYNYRFVFTYPKAIRGIIAVCGGIPGDWDRNPHYRPAHTHVLHIAATDDKWYSRTKNLKFRRQLAERSASVDFRYYTGPHKFPRAAIPDIRKWIEQHV